MRLLKTYTTDKSAKKTLQPGQSQESDDSSSRSLQKPKLKLKPEPKLKLKLKPKPKQKTVAEPKPKPEPATGGIRSLELQFKQYLAEPFAEEKRTKTKTKIKRSGKVKLRPRASQCASKGSIAASSESGSTSRWTNAGSGSSSDHGEKPSQILSTVTFSAGGRRFTRPANVPVLATSTTQGVIDTPEANKPVRLHRLIDYVETKMKPASAPLLVALLRRALAINDRNQKEYSVSLHTLFSELSVEEKAALAEFGGLLSLRSKSSTPGEWLELGRALVSCAETVGLHPGNGSQAGTDPYRYLLFTPGFSVLFNAMRTSHFIRSTDY
jgi:hypothetical protein